MGTPVPIPSTAAEFLKIPWDGHRLELIGGESYRHPTPPVVHQSIVGAVLSGLADHDHPGKVFLGPVDVALSDQDVVAPDLLYLSPERLDRVTETHVQGAPDLVIEILAPETRQRDELTKRRLYERTGVRDYWIVDPELETVKVFRAGERGFEPPTELALERDEALTSPLLPRLELPLARVFE